MARLISFSIFKGGTGKTTSAVNVAAGLAALDRRVLLVDVDQQASATRHVGVHPEEQRPNLYHVLGQQVPAQVAVVDTDFGFDLLSGHPLLAAIEEALEPGDEDVLKRRLEGLLPDYDYVLVDTPPGKGMLSIAALAAADEVVIPLQAERPALDGTADMLRFIQEIVWAEYNSKLKILGILPTMKRRTTSHSPGVIKKARELWGDKVLAVEIPATVLFPRSFDRGKPLVCMAREEEGAQLYLELARWIDENGTH